MPAVNLTIEPYQISSRFYRAMRAKVLILELNAVRDELLTVGIENPDHLRRQLLLVQAQRDEAELLRDFLAASVIRKTAAQAE